MSDSQDDLAVGADESGPKLWVMLVLALPVAAADALTVMLFALQCGIGENLEEPFVTLCRIGKAHTPQAWVYVPALGIPVLAVTVVASLWCRGYTVFMAGLGFAILAGAFMWVRYGAPIGNFGPLLS